jgi:hypothetical protein
MMKIMGGTMKCRQCDCILTDQEAVAKDAKGVYYDLCEACLVPWDEEEWDESTHLDPDDFSEEDKVD